MFDIRFSIIVFLSLRMNFNIRILGSGAAIPTKMRNPSSQVVNVHDDLYLVDCAEGTQLSLINQGISLMKFNQVFISHLHGDHFFGLIGLVTSMHLMGRKKRLVIFGPEGLTEILDVMLKHSGTRLTYPLEVTEIAEGTAATVFETDQLTVSVFPLVHSVPTFGFIFREKPFRRRIKKSFVESHEIPVGQFDRIKDGADYTGPDGTVYPNEEITRPPKRSLSYAYCSDTAYDPGTAEHVRGVDLLYHEATFSHEMKDVAREKKHSTAQEAARVARDAGAGKLVIGHFSARYRTGWTLLEEARKIFPATYLAEDGRIFEIVR